ncbi:MAG: DUF4125 family protein [Deltaproteobacteria bacterium]|nr:DUF4125 family protein [Deltaproteobacteria bacterium]
MSIKEKLIEEILDRELEMFVSVPSKYPAPCQSDPQGFRIMRSSHFSTWAEDSLASYLNDLKAAAEQGRNLMTLKYARMDNLIPKLHDNPLVENKIDSIVSIQLKWQKEMAGRYPYLIGKGRQIEDTEATCGATSFTTYLRGELETYSEDTLACLYRDIIEAEEIGLNLTESLYLYMVKRLGYGSLEDAERIAGRD